jgi:hypothetical protein
MESESDLIITKWENFIKNSVFSDEYLTGF